ncbi:MAG: serine/threonine-protein kinase [Bryobacterales bacterium]|nr:serine/threonine-protein kinase [Bryobacterales bacterium]
MPRLASGVRVTHFVVDECLGEGGMGVVYKATDTRLNRPVVLKFLHPDKEVTKDRRARFLREARAASALNHPGIVTIHEIGEWEGCDYIVMEFVEGRTLQEALRERKQFAAKEAVAMGIQLADAMGAAHAASILHRDLKPANVMLTQRGLVKILDFGLAKHIDSAVTSLSPDDRTVKAEDGRTRAGVLVGSVPYMSPEQAKGGSVDARSDVFALGTLLYELLSGKPAFHAESPVEVLGAILHVDPPPPSNSAPDVPVELEAIIRRAMSKDAGQRWQSMGEMRAALEDLKERGRVSSVGSQTAERVPAQAVARAQRNWIPWAAAAMAMGAAIAVFVLRPAAELPRELALTRVVGEVGVNLDPAISPDGKLVVYASDRSNDGQMDLWLKQIGSPGEPIRLTNSREVESQPSFSPDGRTVVFRSGGGVYAMPTLGGVAPRMIAKDGRRPIFSPDGKRLVYWTGSPGLVPGEAGVKVMIADANGEGEPRQIAAGFASAAWPVWSPKGDRILFQGTQKANNRDTFDWWVTNADGSGTAERWRVVPALSIGYMPYAWLKDRVLCLRDNREISLLELDGDKPAGTPVRRLTTGTQVEASPSVSGDGTRLVFASMATNTDVFSAPWSALSRPGAPPFQRLTSDLAEELPRAVSDDGTKLVLTRRQTILYKDSSDTDARNVWTLDLTTGRKVDITRPPARNFQVDLSPDATRVTYFQESKNAILMGIAPFEGGPERILCTNCCRDNVWLRDNRRMLCADMYNKSLSVLDVETGQSTVYLENSERKIAPMAMTRDGKWLAVTLRKPNGWDVYLMPYREGKAAPVGDWILVGRPVSAHPGVAFSTDGHTLYYGDSSDGYYCLWGQRLDAGMKPVGEAKAVAHFHSYAQKLAAPIGNLRLTASKDHVFLALHEVSGSIWQLEGF